MIYKGNQAFATKDYPAAAKLFEQAWNIARQTSDSSLQATVLVKRAAAMQQQAFAAPEAKRNPLLRQVEDLLKQADSVAKTALAQRYVARNDLAVLYIKTSRFNEALDILKTQEELLDSPDVPARWRAEHAYLLGYCHEQLRQIPKAVESYQVAAVQPATQTRAVNAAFRSLRQLPPDQGIDATFEVADRWVPAKPSDDSASVDSNLVATAMVEALKAWGDEPESSQLLTILLRHWAKESVTPTRFAEQEAARLENLAEEQARLRPTVEALRELFAKDFTPPSDQQAAEKLFGPLLYDEQQRAALSDLLNRLGGQAREAGDEQRAQRYFAAAPQVDPNNLASATYRVLLLAEAGKLDTAELDRLVDQLMFGDNPLKRRKLETAAKWRELVRLHYLIGRMYADAGALSGPWPHSAISQWRIALKANKNARVLDPHNHEPVPGLHENLALAYERRRGFGSAWEHYVRAAEAHVHLEDGPSARMALDTAYRMIGRHRLCGPQLRRVQAVERALQSL